MRGGALVGRNPRHIPAQPSHDEVTLGILMDKATTLEFENLQARASRWVNEEEVRIGWTTTLERALDVHFDAERSRKDSSYNNVIIEYKAPGLFRGSTTSPAFREAMDDRLGSGLIARRAR